MEPVRLQLSRRRGFDLQKLSRETNGLPAVNVARPSKWGNPWTVRGVRNAGWDDPAGWCVAFYREWIGGDAPDQLKKSLAELRGKNLACFCKSGDPCHADVLLQLAKAAP